MLMCKYIFLAAIPTYLMTCSLRGHYLIHNDAVCTIAAVRDSPVLDIYGSLKT